MSELISVIIPVYNRGEQVKKAIASVVQQTYQNWEIVLVDDGSDSLRYQAAFQNERIRVFNNNSNLGVSHARNVGLHKANGSVIAFLDSDNTWEDTFLETMYACMQRLNTKAVFCRWQYVFAESEKDCLDDRSKKLLANQLIPDPIETTWSTMDAMAFLRLAVYEKTNFTHINAALVRREATMPFDETLCVSEDTFWIYLLLTRIGQVSYVDQSFLRFVSSNDSAYLYMDRGEIIELSDLSISYKERLVRALSESVCAYEKLVSVFQNEIKDYQLADCFLQTRNNKQYTILVLKQMLGKPLSKADLKGQPIWVHLRYWLGKPVVQLNRVSHQKIDFY